MSGSLAGGLLPLGNRAGSGSAGSKSTLTGGLIPLTTTAKPTASLRDEPLEEGGGGSGGWDQQEKESERGKEGVAGGSRSDKKVNSVIRICCNVVGLQWYLTQHKENDIQILSSARVTPQLSRSTAVSLHSIPHSLRDQPASPSLCLFRVYVRAKH